VCEKIGDCKEKESAKITRYQQPLYCGMYSTNSQSSRQTKLWASPLPPRAPDPGSVKGPERHFEKNIGFR
ncbi:MAG: hypothetical protein K2P20_06775, partial [Oscillospiraceae bacterium]|nr:hypothetical protein [Oscillospiraceae bacterium]